MTVEIPEVTDFLLHTPPFDALDDESRAHLARSATMHYAQSGTNADSEFNDYQVEGGVVEIRLIRSGAVDCTNTNGTLIARLGPGDAFPRRLTDQLDQQLVYTAHEDSLLLSFPVSEITALRDVPEFATYFSQVTARRRAATTELRKSSGSGGVADIGALRVTVKEVSQPAVQVEPSSSIKFTATEMTKHKLSSAMVVEGERLVGIVTDSDLRSRVLSQGRDPEDAITSVMTPNPPFTYASLPLFEAMLQLSSARINHLPVVEDDKLVGVLTTGAIMRQLQADPIFTAAQFAEASEGELATCLSDVKDVAVRFIDRGATPHEATRLLTSGVDELMQRCVELIEADLGAPPVAYCLVAMGSIGRCEMALSSDQDHALILADDYQESLHGEYFRQWGEKLSVLLAHAGLPLCPGDMMASNPRWRLTVSGWEREFSSWTQDLGQKALMHAQTFFDMRAVVGKEVLCDDVRDAALRAARQDRRFLNALVSLARRREPPLGFFRGFVVDKSGNYANTLDLKRGGLTGVIQLARIFAIEAWVDEVGTRDRLRAAARAGVISARRAEDLVDAFDVFQMIMLSNQANQRRDGAETNARVDPRDLAHLERETLRDAFQLVRAELKSADSRTR